MDEIVPVCKSIDSLSSNAQPINQSTNKHKNNPSFRSSSQTIDFPLVCLSVSPYFILETFHLHMLSFHRSSPTTLPPAHSLYFPPSFHSVSLKDFI
ncbi:hypothetical protein EYC80_007063 [Monilinia laxa]|uniref:Uncharacterized protein n=1 Tax=Monilinia laxa TaxID=61186 RepID=A0A5N6K033_MONLA|nr:hypothetical protein EYC80_007063 [Monilinia laxa]